MSNNVNKKSQDCRLPNKTLRQQLASPHYRCRSRRAGLGGVGSGPGCPASLFLRGAGPLLGSPELPCVLTEMETCPKPQAAGILASSKAGV